MDFNELYRLLSSFTNSVENDFPDFQYCNELLTQLKKKQNIEGLKIARQTLEFAVILSVKMKENKSFERHISQLKPYYYDYENIFTLFLLSQNQLQNFIQIKLIKIEERKSKFISFPMRLEKNKNDLIEIAQQNDWLISEDGTINFKLENDNENVQIPSESFNKRNYYLCKRNGKNNLNLNLNLNQNQKSKSKSKKF
ncbi:26s proteasome non-atpase regulatory subunit 8 [Anaeramoeba ignava]|uniref:26s proteasome non-atpase regulatory subunit 8 n=1 Tax=Anaeramoeba ignava TaxID=1746090 RepID=A0A9Q0LAS4_ANAIG|nr:26s proteasome non-atpase regulatory subunit 8 [Anaeramoeba ignava]